MMVDGYIAAARFFACVAVMLSIYLLACAINAIGERIARNLRAGWWPGRSRHAHGESRTAERHETKAHPLSRRTEA